MQEVIDEADQVMEDVAVEVMKIVSDSTRRKGTTSM